MRFVFQTIYTFTHIFIRKKLHRNLLRNLSWSRLWLTHFQNYVWHLHLLWTLEVKLKTRWVIAEPREPLVLLCTDLQNLLLTTDTSHDCWWSINSGKHNGRWHILIQVQCGVDYNIFTSLKVFWFSSLGKQFCNLH